MSKPAEDISHNARGQSGAGRRRWIAFLIVGIAAIGAIVLVVVHIGDIGSFAMQAARAEPRWLAAAALVQLFTYGCVAGVWARVLRRLDYPVPLVNLYSLALAKMVSDQAAPSGGVAGAAFLFHALGRRGAPYGAAFTVFSFTAVTFLAAFILAAAISFAAVATLERASPALTASIAAFAALVLFLILCIAVILVTGMKAPPLVSRFPRYAEFSRWVRTTATFVASERYLFLEATLIQFIVRILDGLTLYLIVLSIGGSAPYAVCFFAVALASVAATVAPSPMGLGTFEAGMIATLTLFGVTIEDALTATLVFRGLSLWLPLAPGFYIIQREILKRNAAQISRALSRE